MNKAEIFVQHVQNHLNNNPELNKEDKKVHCRICMKDIDEIYNNEKSLIIRDALYQINESILNNDLYIRKLIEDVEKLKEKIK